MNDRRTPLWAQTQRGAFCQKVGAWWEEKDSVYRRHNYQRGDTMPNEWKCPWCTDGGMMERYHDEEWGVPVHDDRKQFEFLTLEVMQCGLNWTITLKKREIFRACFANFDFNEIAGFREEDILRIMETPGMIRSRRKIEAVIQNAHAFQQIRQEFGTFDAFLWSFTGGHTQVYEQHGLTGAPSHNALSDTISQAMKKRGFKFVGSITIYAHLQASGLVNDHDRSCRRFREINAAYPVTMVPADHAKE